MWDWYEARAYFASKVENKLKNETHHLKADVDFHATQQNIIGVAEKETSTARRITGKQSKKSQTENIRRNRFEEREEQRRLQFFDLNQKDLTLSEQQIDDKQNKQAIDPETKEDVYIPPKSNVQRIQEIRKRKMGK